jgi:serine/threonine protein kinase
MSKSKKATLKDYEDVIIPGKNTAYLGKGSYGYVKLVRRKGEDPNQYYALKTIDKKILLTYASADVLKREIKIQKKLKHPYMIKLYEYFEDNENVYLLLEYAEEGNLFNYLMKNKKKLCEKEAFIYFYQTCVGISYIHKKNIIHRDLKPENLLLNKAGNIKICDFGWSAEASEHRKTLCGTAEYMAPEMVQNKAHDFKLDIWSLGILLFELLHGYPPFRGKSNEEKFKKIVQGDLEFKNASPAAQDLIRSLLKHDSTQRPGFDDIFNHPWVKTYEVQLVPKSQEYSTTSNPGTPTRPAPLSRTYSIQSIPMTESTVCTAPDFKSVSPALSPGKVNGDYNNTVKLGTSNIAAGTDKAISEAYLFTSDQVNTVNASSKTSKNQEPEQMIYYSQATVSREPTPERNRISEVASVTLKNENNRVQTSRSPSNRSVSPRQENAKKPTSPNRISTEVTHSSPQNYKISVMQKPSPHTPNFQEKLCPPVVAHSGAPSEKHSCANSIMRQTNLDNYLIDSNSEENTLLTKLHHLQTSAETPKKVQVKEQSKMSARALDYNEPKHSIDQESLFDSLQKLMNRSKSQNCINEGIKENDTIKADESNSKPQLRKMKSASMIEEKMKNGNLKLNVDGLRGFSFGGIDDIVDIEKYMVKEQIVLPITVRTPTQTTPISTEYAPQTNTRVSTDKLAKLEIQSVNIYNSSERITAQSNVNHEVISPNKRKQSSENTPEKSPKARNEKQQQFSYKSHSIPEEESRETVEMIREEISRIETRTSNSNGSVAIIREKRFSNGPTELSFISESKSENKTFNKENSSIKKQRVNSKASKSPLKPISIVSFENQRQQVMSKFRTDYQEIEKKVFGVDANNGVVTPLDEVTPRKKSKANRGGLESATKYLDSDQKSNAKVGITSTEKKTPARSKSRHTPGYAMLDDPNKADEYLKKLTPEKDLDLGFIDRKYIYNKETLQDSMEEMRKKVEELETMLNEGDIGKVSRPSWRNSVHQIKNRKDPEENEGFFRKLRNYFTCVNTREKERSPSLPSDSSRRGRKRA